MRFSRQIGNRSSCFVQPDLIKRRNSQVWSGSHLSGSCHFQPENTYVNVSACLSSREKWNRSCTARLMVTFDQAIRSSPFLYEKLRFVWTIATQPTRDARNIPEMKWQLRCALKMQFKNSLCQVYTWERNGVMTTLRNVDVDQPSRVRPPLDWQQLFSLCPFRTAHWDSCFDQIRVSLQGSPKSNTKLTNWSMWLVGVKSVQFKSIWQVSTIRLEDIVADLVFERDLPLVFSPKDGTGAKILCWRSHWWATVFQRSRESGGNHGQERRPKSGGRNRAHWNDGRGATHSSAGEIFFVNKCCMPLIRTRMSTVLLRSEDMNHWTRKQSPQFYKTLTNPKWDDTCWLLLSRGRGGVSDDRKHLDMSQAPLAFQFLSHRFKCSFYFNFQPSSFAYAPPPSRQASPVQGSRRKKPTLARSVSIKNAAR